MHTKHTAKLQQL